MNCADEKNYYAVLGVLRTADLADIGAAYRTLVRKYHPDTSHADAESLLKLKLINEAYEVLSDAHKRQTYDRSLSGGPSTIPVTVSSFHARPQSAHSQWGQSSPATTLPTSKDFEVELPIAPEEARFGGPCEFSLTIPRLCGPCGGSGRDEDGTCSVCHGRGKIRCRHRIQLTIPRGVTTGSILRLPLQGSKLRRPLTNLLVRFKIQPSW